jgi:hypothetical protein
MPPSYQLCSLRAAVIVSRLCVRFRTNSDEKQTATSFAPADGEHLTSGNPSNFSDFLLKD